MANEKERLLSAKSRCQQAILDAIIEFEESTGLDVSDIEYHKTSLPVFKDTVAKKWVTIVILL